MCKMTILILIYISSIEWSCGPMLLTKTNDLKKEKIVKMTKNIAQMKIN